jgi:tetraacyldisaccharide 4'-kinase
MSQALLRCWYGACTGTWMLLILLLRPFSWLFRALIWLRRLSYRLGLFRTIRLHVPVVVVGNINVGGSGKTPLTLVLIEWLRQAGFTPGVISRGYGGRARTTMQVREGSDPGLVGDEPVLIARRAGCPVWIGRSRGEAGRRLLAFHPEVDVILTDDGLQHYALARDVEIVVADGERGFGNGCLLPAGPLREPVSRLASVDAVVMNGVGEGMEPPVPCFTMTVSGTDFVNLAQPDLRASADRFRDITVHAIAGIGHPERFFHGLETLGLKIVRHPFADHHMFSPKDLPDGTVLMTEKDAVKCAAFPRSDTWYLAVDAEVEGGLKTLLLNALKDRNGFQTS